jgi:tetratricopeptide (TPR) repeat protein
MSGPRLIASCCFAFLVVPIASLGQPNIPRNGEPADLSPIVSVHELRIPEKAREAYTKGAQRLAVNDWAGGIPEFQKAIAAWPDFYEAYYKIGIANLQLQHNDDAETVFRKSIELSDGKFAPPLFGLGLLLGNTKQYDDGVMYIRTGLNIAPTSPRGHFALAWVLYSAQRVVEAERSARAAVLYDPNFAMAHLLLAQIHRHQNNTAAMIDDLDAYLRLAPDSPRSASIRATRDEAQSKLELERDSAAEKVAETAPPADLR